MSFVIGGVQFRAAEGVSTAKGTLFFGGDAFWQHFMTGERENLLLWLSSFIIPLESLAFIFRAENLKTQVQSRPRECFVGYHFQLQIWFYNRNASFKSSGAGLFYKKKHKNYPFSRIISFSFCVCEKSNITKPLCFNFLETISTSSEFWGFLTELCHTIFFFCKKNSLWYTVELYLKSFSLKLQKNIKEGLKRLKLWAMRDFSKSCNFFKCFKWWE